jgi:hypothetical protein
MYQTARGPSIYGLHNTTLSSALLLLRPPPPPPQHNFLYHKELDSFSTPASGAAGPYNPEPPAGDPEKEYFDSHPRLSQNFDFWNSCLEFGGRNGLYPVLQKVCFKTSRVLEQTQGLIIFYGEIL